ncbi:DUF1348-domain-containing protein [Saitoella complicata NRRL Y-17804]|uniref:DUF1348-domain-containing protein n=1 Tax=Saitoella complicata (strain BCRC 22490 / CBS 7301 / JCM 7358 / NBRC 10748 / NRRL Y-17804) TaxID=698492 RepID=UPI000867DBD2|nr:DUF1348-domain-containing protein [Saitoella complicata NRRL Y-17804]ODQ49705.1 DUF1348-domain-containing protein [Saitoella complicata NRRL Y-17804]
MSAVPPFTEETARKKVKAAQDLWNTKDPVKVAKAYTEDSIWRNRDQFFQGTKAIEQFLTDKWSKESGYRLRKELFTFAGNRIAVQFWYEFWDDSGQWWRCYGLEHWTFAEDGKMKNRMMSVNDVKISEGERWFEGDADVNSVTIPEGHWSGIM